MNEALERNEAEFLSQEEGKLLKKLYRNIVKVLHPDINPNVTEETHPEHPPRPSLHDC